MFGPSAEPETLLGLARHAEAAGFGTLWAADRLLYPVKPRSKYPASPDGKLPDEQKRTLDPLTTLAFLASATSTIRLGTAVLNLPFYNPVVLGRRLASLDILSQGRVTVGFGMGWSEDEFEATGGSGRGRGARAEEFLSVLESVWGPDPVSFEGKHFRLAASLVEAKPVQKPRPPIYLAAFAPAALDRVARRADGWIPVGFPLPILKKTWQQLQQQRADGRPLSLIVGSFPHLTDAALPENRGLLNGNREQWQADIEELRALGAAEVYLVGRGSLDEGRRLIDQAAALL